MTASEFVPGMAAAAKRSPRCSQHGPAKVPCEVQYAHITKGTIDSVVLWDKVRGRMVEEVYAPDGVAELSHPKVDDETLGDQIEQQITTGELVKFSAIVKRTTKLYKIDDRREGHMHTYMVSLGESPRTARIPLSQVYYFLNGEVHENPRLTRSEDVVGLMDYPDALRISNTSGYAGAMVDDLGNALGQMNNRVVVWDLSKIYS